MLLADAFDHVVDSKYWEIFETWHIGFNLPPYLGLSKFVVLEILAALLILAIFIPMARRAERGDPPRGLWDNTFESLLTFIRERVVRPNLGSHDCDRYVPFFWTVFLFILFCNLFGMFPFMGSPTASIAVTAALALCAFLAIHGTAMVHQGVGHYFAHHFPHIEAPFGLGVPISIMIGVIELFGHLIKAFVLSVRLFANLFAGHLVLAFILSFIVMAKNSNLLLFGTISIGSAFMVTALSLLELFVAFLQAFVFTYLTAIFMGSVLHPAH
jgi:F-type H+-transporting ATPase subunit a